MTVHQCFAMKFRHATGITHTNPDHGPPSDKSDHTPPLNLLATALAPVWLNKALTVHTVCCIMFVLTNVCFTGPNTRSRCFDSYAATIISAQKMIMVAA